MIPLTMSDELCLPQLLARHAREHPDKVFLQQAESGVSYTYAVVDQEIGHWRRVFRGLGVVAGQPVLLMLPTCAESVFVWAALASLRAIAIPINTDYRARMLAHALENSAAAVAVVGHEYLSQLSEAASAEHPLTTVIVPDGAAADGAGASYQVIPRAALLESTTSGSGSVGAAGPRVREIAAIVYTSGTTGPSKGVTMPWRQLHSTVNAFFPEGSPVPGDVFYVPFPMFHLTGIGLIYLAALVDGTVVLRRRFKTEEYWPDVARFGCTITLMLGAMVDFLLDAPPGPEERTNPLRDVMMMPINRRIDEFEERFGVRTCTLYGMTEVGVPVVHGWWTPEHPGSCGRLREGYTIRLVDEDDNEVPPGHPGELIARTNVPWTMSTGYWRMPEATVEAWRNQWLHTGDALRCDADGYFYFVDRVKDTIRRRGENISSLELDREILDHPAVADVATIGQRGEWSEDEVKAFIVLKPGHSLDGSELATFLARRVPAFMVPRFVEIVDDLPRTPTGKVRKQELRQRQPGHATWDRQAQDQA